VNWIALLVGGLFEVVWAIGLKHSAGFTKLTPSLITVGAMGVSLYLLGVALRTLPLGTAYAVWVGVGVVGTAVAGSILFHESVTPLRLISLGLVIAGIAGLKMAGSA